MFEDNLVDPVRLVYFTIPKSPLYVPGRAQCETCDDVQHLVEEIVAISDKLSLEIHNLEREPEEARRWGVAEVPALILFGPESGGVRYLGAPSGYEFSTLLQDIQFISKGETALSAATREALAGIPDPIHLQVFVTPT
jgi:alkyl hydroperoxide reductase subunit AhpF